VHKKKNQRWNFPKTTLDEFDIKAKDLKSKLESASPIREIDHIENNKVIVGKYKILK
jgi:hypothetical protein